MAMGRGGRRTKHRGYVVLVGGVRRIVSRPLHPDALFGRVMVVVHRGRDVEGPNGHDDLALRGMVIDPYHG